jgi:hypothetical protein
MKEQVHKDWIRSFDIGLPPPDAEQDPSKYLVWLVRCFFPESRLPPEINPNADPEKQRGVRLAYIRSIFEENGIAPPAHWSPIVDLGDPRPEKEAQQAAGLASFNQVLRNLKHYLTPDKAFRKTLSADLKVRRTECETLLAELEGLANDHAQLQDQIATIQRLIDTDSGESQIAADKIMKRLYGVRPVERGVRGKTTLGQLSPL